MFSFFKNFVSKFADLLSVQRNDPREDDKNDQSFHFLVVYASVVDAAVLDGEAHLLASGTDTVLAELHDVTIVVAIVVHVKHGARHVFEAVRTEEFASFGNLLDDREASVELLVVVAFVVLLHEIEHPRLGLFLRPTRVLLYGLAHFSPRIDEDHVVTLGELLFDGELGIFVRVVTQEEDIDVADIFESLGVPVHVDAVHFAGDEEHSLASLFDTREHVEGHGGLTDTGGTDDDDVGGGHESTVGRHETVEVGVARFEGNEHALIEREVGDANGFGLHVLFGGQGLIGVLGEEIGGDDAEVFCPPIIHFTTCGGVDETHALDVHNYFLLICLGNVLLLRILEKLIFSVGPVRIVGLELAIDDRRGQLESTVIDVVDLHGDDGVLRVARFVVHDFPRFPVVGEGFGHVVRKLHDGHAAFVDHRALAFELGPEVVGRKRDVADGELDTVLGSHGIESVVDFSAELAKVCLVERLDFVRIHN